MSQAMSPYQSPQPEAGVPHMQSANISSVPKVFGILHLVFGGLGLLMGIFGLVMAMFKDKMEEFQFSTFPSEVREEMREAMAPLYETQKWDMLSTVISMILAVLLIVAGLKLIKYRSQGRDISNIYSLLSILHKVFAIVLLVVIKAPAMKQVGEALEDIGGQGNANMAAIMGPYTMIFGIGMALVMMVYPILSYVMLSKKQARESLS